LRFICLRSSTLYSVAARRIETTEIGMSH
jgi:hypothetical protein